MTTESSMWKWLSKNPIPDVCLERHENLVGVGAPDVWGYHSEHGSFWVELKQSERPKRPTSKTGIKIRNSQKIWFRKMSKLDCEKHWFLIQISEKKYLVPGDLYVALDQYPEKDLEDFDVSNHSPRDLIALCAKGFG